MFGGYAGQEKDKEKIRSLEIKLKENPNDSDLREDLEKARKNYQDKMESALRAYSRLW